MTRTDDQLVESINRGDVEAGLTALQARYQVKIYRFVLGLVQDTHLAQDVAQETFIKVFLKSHLYKVGTNFRAWLFEIARNQALSALRSRRRSPRPITSIAAQPDENDGDLLDQLIGDGMSRKLEEQEFMALFSKAVSELPDKYMEIFTRCVIQGRSYQDVARELDLPTGTVAIRIMRARKRLFEALSPHLDRLRRPPACVQ
ncbi:MAG: RNA polymerase sigma factor [Planctomycetota bacterium]